MNPIHARYDSGEPEPNDGEEQPLVARLPRRDHPAAAQQDQPEEDQQERSIAPLLHHTLKECRTAIACDYDSYIELEHHAFENLKAAGFDPDYVAVCDSKTLEKVTHETEQVVILAAAKLGKTRLIDNLIFIP